ncbi:hypothetical protein SLS62_010126 [Diatrype stigma]|uniref:Alpha/beta hydrolase fold-3 domain-containing protein n=1 Tax=Diatrype stigma TaxID=117547 RepID=A0AAN9YJ34_9PEZI
MARTATTPLHWPTPLHDAMQGYDWILKNLAPPEYKRRDVYTCGSYLGASLATSIALTESYPHEHMAVRGCVALNGIYNWTMFLPDHPINQPPKKNRSKNKGEDDGHRSNDPKPPLGSSSSSTLRPPPDPAVLKLKQQAGALFSQPDGLFDPFASPCLFFQTPGLLVPRTFTEPATAADYYRATMSMALEDFLSPDDPLTAEEFLRLVRPRAPRRSAVAFPPWNSTLKIPEALLLHTAVPAPPPSLLRRRRRRAKARVDALATDSFRAQAEALARAMRRSVDKELKERRLWDPHLEGIPADEATRRVQVSAVGAGGRRRVGGGEGAQEGDGEGKEFGFPPGGDANRFVQDWLEDRLGR